MFTTKYLDLIVVYKNIERKQDRKRVEIKFYFKNLSQTLNNIHLL